MNRMARLAGLRGELVFDRRPVMRIKEINSYMRNIAKIHRTLSFIFVNYVP